jgi:LysM repeat protein
MLQFNGKSLTLPINPEELSPTRKANNTEMDIIGLGKATRKGEPGLPGFTIESFFPGPNSYFYTGVSPRTCIDFINNLWETENINNNVGRIVTLGLPIDINMYFVIDDFEYDHKAGEEEDVYYKLKIKKYIPYGVKTIDVKLSGLAAARATSPAVEIKPTNPVTNTIVASVPKTYTVERGDCLWNITKACTGNGADWPELYELNRDVIGENPSLIYPGQELILPDDWDAPISVTGL